MTRRLPRTPKTSADAPAVAGAPVDTSLADAARLEYDDDEVSPINPAVRLRLVADYKLERVVRGGARGVAEERVQLVGAGVTAGMSKDEIGRLCGPGEYVFTWLRVPAATRAGGEASSRAPRLEPYRISRFSIAVAGVPDVPGAGAAPVGALPALAPLPTTTAPGERLVPASLTLDEQWFAAWQVQAANDRADLVEVVRALVGSVGAMAQRSAEQNATILALGANMVTAMREQSRAELDRSTQQALELVQLREAMQQGPGGLEAILAPLARRLADRLVPETAAKPDEIQQTLAQVRAALPQITELGALAPQIRAGLARIDRVSHALGMGDEAAPPRPPASSPEELAPASAEDAPRASGDDAPIPVDE